MDRSNYFRQKLLLWHHSVNKRQLPWKGEKDVYRIWLSEIILQQTRAEQGWKYYERFVNQYPTVQKLAKAPLEEVYKLWEGLGYYNRCRNLHSTAQFIAFELKGKFPDTFETIIELKGVGPYTAAAIASFGFGLPHAVVDGNVFRVLSRFFGIDTPIDSTEGKKQFQQLANVCLDTSDPAAYNQAIMDFGATVCKPDLPDCRNCNLKTKCVAFEKGVVNELPFKEKKNKIRKRWFRFYIMELKGTFAVQKRTGKDVWGNLYEFPNEEYKTEKEWKLANTSSTETWFKSRKIKQSFTVLSTSKPIKQQLSHQLIYGNAVLVQIKGKQTILQDWEWKTATQLKQLPFPKLLNDFLNAGVLELFAARHTTVKQKT
ncbi:A/G-specific adenine glycosylase [Lacibacter sediminis]|uniref:Adenine DNA glycosylase n=1 Tax=Lacibacter sediminis TaxID=2760713 RepID=A0A7G5XEG9_9BACT|nr:A/G-specific adenine glycosylase [Lacibacter sediminis]QNA43872.1 A/G-specific adenine glycosylase [Lacibacter sediminis]